LNCKNNNKININNKQLKKPKKDPIKTRSNKINSNNNSNKNTPVKNRDVKTRRNNSKNSKNSSPKITNIKEVKSPNKRNNSTKSPNKKEEKKVIKKNIVTNKKDDENNINQINDSTNKSIIKKENVNNVNQKQSKTKKKGKRKENFIIDEELKKSTPIRNLKKQPKGILKKSSLTQTFILNSPPPKAQIRSKSSEKKVTFSSDKNKKYKTFSEIFQSPSKLKATPLKRKINSEKKSSHKKNNIMILEEDKEQVNNNFVGKKRNISFNYERIVKEYNPKTPVRDVKAQLIRKSPLERKKNQNINLN